MSTRPPRRPYGRQPPKEPTPPKDEPCKIDGDLPELTVNQGQKIEYVVKVSGTKPITATWWRNGDTKLKSGKNSKIVFTQGEAKLLIMEAEATDDGEYKLECSNKFGSDSKLTRVTVIVPEKLKGNVKQKARASVDVEKVELKGFRKDSTQLGADLLPVGGASRTPRGSVARGSLSGKAGGVGGSRGSGGGPEIPCIVVDGGGTPGGSRRGSTLDGDALKKRGSKVPDDEDEDTKYFKTKPQNQVVKLGETMFVDCTFKIKPPSVNWYRGAISVKTDPRATITYDPDKLYSSMQLTKCKPNDEAKFKCQVEDEAGETSLELAGFSVFVKDPNDSGLDFRSLLKHKDLKKKRGSKNDPNWSLNPVTKEQQEKGRNRRMSTIDLSRKTTTQEGKEKVASQWLDELEDVTCQEKETNVELSCKFSKPTAKVRWYKNKIEIFQGNKYNMTAKDGVFRLIFTKVNKEDASRYICSADLKETSCYLTVESKKDEYYFTQKLLKSTNVKRKKDLSLECMLNDPRPEVTWTKNGEKLEYTPDKYEISRRENRCILRIKNASQEDACEFACIVEGDKTQGKVVVEEPDYDFEKNLFDADAYEKESAEFECEVNDEEAPVEWFREDKKIDVNDPKYFTIENGKKRMLRVNNVGSKDEGVYTCKIKTQPTKTTQAKLYVAPDVIIKEQLKNQKKIEGEEAVFKCKVKNPKNNPVKWFRNGEEITPGDKYEVKEEEGGLMKLIVKDLKLDDAAEFMCKIGDRSTSAKLQVDVANKPPVVDLDAIPRELTVKAGQDVSIEIPYTGHPKPTAAWTKNKGKLDDQVVTSQTANNCKINLRKVKRSDAGEYEVELKNKAGKVNVPITLKVIDKPSKPQGPLEVMDVYKDRCRIAWRPPKDDGGLPIEGYLIEAQDVATGKWTQVEKIDDLQSGVPGLEPGHRYKFRVKAVNSLGESEPLDSDSETIAKDPFDPPGAPGKPTITDYDKDRAEIKWTSPKSDGGSPIQKYVIEKKEKGKDWEKVGMVPPEETSAEVPNLEEGKEYEFRVTPVNEAGPGKASPPSDPVKTKNRKVKPRIDRKSFNEIYSFKAGQEFDVEVKFIGEPPPTPKWTQNKKSLENNKEITIATKVIEQLDKLEDAKVLNEEYITNLKWRNLTRKDTGVLDITVTNQYGSDSAKIELIVFGNPGKPEGPLQVTDIQKNSATIKWNPPKDDGGKPLKCYKLEKLDPNTGKWEPIHATVPPDVTEFTIPKLKEGEDYKFRVRAENELGESEPLDTDGAVTIKNPYKPTDPPGKPVVVDSDRTFIKVKWEPPKKDGGAPVTGYNVERKDPKTGKWSKINDEPVKTPEFTDNKVHANKWYEYRVTAENEGGESKPSEPSDPIRARPLKEAPKLDLSGLSGKDIKVKAGEPIKIEIPLRGTPTPLITWLKDGKDLPPSERVKQTIEEDPLTGEDKVVFHIPSSLRSDTGKLTIKAKNEFGEDSGDLNVIVVDKPLPPTEVNVKEIFADKCTVTWKPPTDDGGAEISGYIIEKFEEDSGVWLPVADGVGGNKHVVKGLKKGKRYKFRVKAENRYGVSNPTENSEGFITAKNPYDRPGPPGKPEVLDSDKDFITIKWDPPLKDGGAPITGYKVERKDPKTGAWKKINTDPVTTPEFTDKRVLPLKEYEYRVIAENAGGESDPSEGSKPIKAKKLKAAPKMDLSAFDGRDVRIRAGEPLKLEIPIEGSPTPTVVWKKDGKELLPSERILQVNGEELVDLSIPVSQRSDKGKYELVLKNPYGEESGAINVIVLDRPSPPENVQVSDIYAEHCKLTWQPPEDDGSGEILGYVVEKCKEGSNTWTKVPGNPTEPNHHVKGLEEGKKYKFRVKAENQYGVSDPCETDRFILAKNPYEKPGEPKNVEIDKFDKGSVTLKWKPPNDDGGNEIKGYIIEKCPAKGKGDWAPVNLSPVSGTAFTVPGLVEGSEWEFRVVAVNDAGSGKPSKSTGPHKVRDPVYAAGPPGMPVIEKVSPNAIDLSWEKPLNDGGGKIEGYIVEKKTKNGDWEPVNSIPFKDTNCTVPHLKEGEEYQFRVSAVNEAGQGNPSPPTMPVVAEKPKVKPSIDLSGIKDIKVLAGETIKIALPIKGWPIPRTSWDQDGKPIDADDRTKIETTEEQALLVIKDAKRSDKGAYTINLKNECGSCEATINVTVLAPPAPPEGPLEPVKTTPEEITVEWKPPKDDGGGKIKKYVLEMKKKGAKGWSKCPGTIGPDETQATATNLEPGEEYEFRVKAVNEFGESEPLVTTEPIIAKYPFDPPGKPGVPECLSTTEDSITLQWEPPLKDGGKPIKGYILEKREVGSKRWTKACPHEIDDTEFTVKNLIEGRPYEFRVAAVNEAGPGEYSDNSAAIKPAPPPCAPRVDLSNLNSEVTAKVGEPYKIRIPYKGTPLPEVSWFNGPKQITEDGRITFEVRDDEVILHCKSAKKEDEGPLSAVLKNHKGSDTAHVKLIVQDKPSPPEGPLEVSKVTPESCKLSWDPPKNDGGSPITNYVVEKKDKTSGKWVPVSKFCKGTECDVNDLEPGETYEFRVSAVNENGQSEPLLTTKPIVAKYPFDPPGKPGKPKIEDVDETSVSLSWTEPSSDGGNPIKGYVVEAKKKKDAKWTPLNSRFPCKDTKFTAEGLDPYEEYEFRVLAKNLAGLGDPSQPSDTVITKPKPTKASAPGSLKPEKIGPNSIDLSWTKPTDDGGSPIKGYRLEKKTPYGDWEPVSDSPIFGESATVPNLTEGEEYQFRVAAITDAGVGNFSNATAPIKAEKPKRAPDSPENLQVSDVFADRCKLSWLAPTNDGGVPITGYLVEKMEEGTGNWVKVPGPITGESCVVPGLEEGKKYHFRVSAINNQGTGEPTQTNKATLAKNPFDAPGEPKNVEISKYDRSSVTLKWKEPLDDGGNPISGYIIEKCPAKGKGDWASVNSSPVSGTTFTVPGLVEGSEWEFRVVAVNDAGPGKPSKSTGPHKVRDPVFGAGAPGTPVAEEVTPNSITLAWDKPLDDGGAPIEGYIVEMLDDDGKWVEVSPVVKDPRYKVNHLKEGKAYQFRVKAVNEAGAGKPSASTGPIVAEKPAEKPSMDLSKLGDIIVRAGETLKIEVPIKGWPLPTASWELNGSPIDIGGRTECKVLEDMVILTVKDVTRKDTGAYNLKLRNPSGSVEGSINVKVLAPPAPPEGPLEPVKTTPEEITVEWRPPKDDGGGKIKKYVLEKRKKGAKSWSKCPGTIGPDETQATATNLEPGEEYEFRVKAVNEFGESEPLVTTEPIIAKYPFDKPGKPGAPEGIATTEDSITLQWEPPFKDGGKPIRGYILEKREVGSKRWTRACPHEIDDTEFTVKNLIEGKPYEFRVAAVNEAGVGEFAECEKPIVPKAPATAPKINLDGLNLNVDANVGEPFKIKVPFTGGPLPTAQFFNGDKEILPDDRFKIEVVNGEAILTCRAAKKEDQGNYRVVLKNPKGSDSTDFKVKINDKPEAPEGPLKVSKITPESCKLSWDPPKSDGGKPITHYVIEKKAKGSGWEPVSRYCKGNTCDVSDLEGGQEYEFRVMAVNELGQSEPLLTDKPIIAKYPFDPPGKPGLPKVEDVDEDSVTLSWSKPLEDGGDRISGYVVEVREKDTGKWRPVNARNPCKDNKYTVDNLTTGKEYEFRVRAKNLAGLGEPSNPTSGVTPLPKATKASPPGVPSVDKVSKNSVDLSWTPPRTDGGSPIRGYQVEKRFPNGTWEKVNHIPVDGTNIHIPDLDEGREYEFRVAAVTRAGMGDFSLNTAPVKVCQRKAAKEPEFVQKPRDVTTPYDEDAKFEVVVDGEPAPTVKWFKDGFELKPSLKYRFKEDEDGKVQLILKGVKPEDAGEITCEISNEKGRETAVAKLTVQTPPQVDNDFRDQFVDKGDTLRLRIPFKGTGPFSFKLKRNNKDLPEDHSRIKIVEHDDYVILQIKDAEKDDAGKYKLDIINDSGVGTCDIPIKVRAPPGICGRPLEVSAITKHACQVKWKVPEDDGGSKITHYIIERREVGKPYWTTVSSHTRDLECDVQGLTEHKEYLFRVCACNAHGPGEWLETDGPIVAKMPFDPPSPPGEPEAQEVGGNFVSLSWERPKHDGGGRLLGYFIEKKEFNSEKWSRINTVPTPANVFNVPNLIEDREYDFRIFAVNEAGESKPVETSKRIKVTDPKAAKVPEILEPLNKLTVAQGKTARFHATITGQPQVDIQWFKGSRELVANLKYEMLKEGDTYSLEVKNVFGEDADEYCVKASTSAGSRSSRAELVIKSPPKINVPPRFAETAQFEKSEDVVIKLPFTGNPKPTAKWFKNAQELSESSKYHIELKERHAILTIRNAERSDDGGYRLTLENDLGEDTAVINVAVNDAPDAPRLVSTDNVYHESVMLSWKPPLNDGGGFITQYIVEKQEEGMSSWIRCAPSRFAYAGIEGLSSNKNYKFRVIAENVYGRSKPSEEISIKTVSENEGRQRLGLAPEDERKKKYTGSKPDNYDRLYRNIWSDNYKPLPVDVKSTSIHDNYEICEEIGSGAFGKVHRAVERSSGNNYIAKFVNTPLPADKHTVKNEISIMNDLRHPNLMVLHDAYEEPKEMALVYEYLPGGELFDTLASGDGAKESDIIEYIKQLCSGVKYMHDKNVCHLDLRPECLLTSTKKGKDLKLIDFSMAARLDPDHHVKVSTRSPEYAPPEILDREPVGFYSDMWSIGVLTYALLSGISPFKASSDDEVRNRVRRANWSFDSDAFKGISAEGRDFISKLLVKNPTNRMNIHEALDHPWLRTFHPDFSHRISSSKYHGIRDYIRSRYSNYDVPNPTIGRIANYSSLASQRPREYLIHDTQFDRREAMPRFVIKPYPTSVKEGGVASFKCTVMAGSPPIITWYFKGQALNPSIKYMPKYYGNDYELRIGRCKLEDRGSYVVKAVNSYGSSEESALLSVDSAPPAPIQRAFSVQPTASKKHDYPEVPKFQEELKKPKIIFPLRDRFLQKGVNFKLIATVESNPLAKATWYKDGKEIHSGHHFRLDNTVGVFTLECPSCEPSDEGRYKCVAENSLGSHETECKITVNSKANLSPLDTGFTRDSGDVLSGSHFYSSFAHENGFDHRLASSGYPERSMRASSIVHNDSNISIKVNVVDSDSYRRPSQRSSYIPPRPTYTSGSGFSTRGYTRSSVAFSSGASPFNTVTRKTTSTYGSSNYDSSTPRSFKRSISHSAYRKY